MCWFAFFCQTSCQLLSYKSDTCTRLFFQNVLLQPYTPIKCGRTANVSSASSRTICISSALKRRLTVVRGHFGRKTRTVYITNLFKHPTVYVPVREQILSFVSQSMQVTFKKAELVTLHYTADLIYIASTWPFCSCINNLHTLQLLYLNSCRCTDFFLSHSCMYLIIIPNSEGAFKTLCVKCLSTCVI